MVKRNFCLVTGAPRSGTTVVGELLSLGLHAEYVYEPMNYHAGDRCIPGYFAVPGSKDFPFEVAGDLFSRIRTLDLHLKAGVWDHETGWRKLRKQLIGGRSRMSLRISKLNILARNIVWKDPFAFFSIPYLIEHTDIPIVVTRRPVEGICASFKRLGWGFDLNKLLEDLGDPQLPAGLLEGLDMSDSVQNGAALWNIMQARTDTYAKSERCRVVELHDLLANPVAQVRELAHHCRIPFDENKAIEIQRRYSRKSSAEVPTTTGAAHVKNRDVNSIPTYWKKTLAHDDLESIETVARRFRTVRVGA